MRRATTHMRRYPRTVLESRQPCRARKPHCGYTRDCRQDRRWI